MLLDVQLKSVRSISDLYLVPQKNQMLVCLLQQEPELWASVSSKRCAKSLCCGSPCAKRGWPNHGGQRGLGGTSWSFLVWVLYGIAGFSMEHSLHRAPVIPGDTPLFIPWQESSWGWEQRAPLGPEEWAELAAELWVLRPWYFLKTPFGLICSSITELVQHVWPSPKEKGYGAERNNVNSCVCVCGFLCSLSFFKLERGDFLSEEWRERIANTRYSTAVERCFMNWIFGSLYNGNWEAGQLFI